MVRINLLPPEILEKRKFEQSIVYVALGGLAAVLVIGVVYAFLSFQVGAKNEVLQQNKETATQLLAQAQAYEVFQNKVDVLQSRKQVAGTALSGRVDWGRIANELSLVLPSDVWATFIRGSEIVDDEGLEIAGIAIDSPSDVPDVGHKAVAKTLVRLADLELVNNVQLVFSEKDRLDEDAGSAPIINFAIETGVVRPAATTTPTASVPAPPNQTAP